MAKVILQSEFNRFVKALYEKHPELRCEGFPYYPEEIDVQFKAEVYKPTPPVSGYTPNKDNTLPMPPQESGT